MHKNTKVLDITVDSITSVILAIGNIYSTAHIPVSVKVVDNKVNHISMNKWWTSRSIPASRMGIQTALEILDIPSPISLVDKAYGLSLSDHYWIKPCDSDIQWGDVNFFENDFSDDLGDILFNCPKDRSEISLMSPDNTSDGWLKKKWKIIDGKRCLIKSGSGATQQEPYNEVIASIICDRLKIDHAPYKLIFQGDYPYSICDNFVDKNTEFISAFAIYNSFAKKNHISTYEHYIDSATRLGIPNIQESINKMILLDYIIYNQDRHLNNFGAIRNVDTLEYISTAPIFDNGSSLWYDKPIALINKEKNITCKPFKKTHEQQIQLITSFEFFDPSLLSGIDDEIRELTKNSIFIDQLRTDAICSGILDRIDKLS